MRELICVYVCIKYLILDFLQSKRKLPAKGSKEYKRCLDNWNVYKEVTELVDNRPDLLQTQRYEIVAARHNVLFTKIRQKYIRIILRIEMSGKPITPDHPINNELLQMLAISESEAVKFSKAKTAAKLDKVIEEDEKETDTSEDEVDESPTVSLAKKFFSFASKTYFFYSAQMPLADLKKDHPITTEFVQIGRCTKK